MRYVGFIRNVMLGREGLHRTVLLKLISQAGGANAVSFMTTGNIAFDTDPAELAPLVDDLQTGISRVIDRGEPVFVRTVARLRHLVAGNPFAAAPFGDALNREISFASDVIAIPNGLPLFNRRGDACIFRIDGADAFSASRLISGRTSSVGGLVQALAGGPVTTRSVNTIRHIVNKEDR